LPYDPAQARRLLAEAGYSDGFEAGDLTPIPPFFTMGEAVGNYLGSVGIRTKMRTMERAAFLSAWREKKLKGLILTGSGAFGNAATRIEPYGVSTGVYAYGGYPDIDALFRQQAEERDRTKREALLQQLQRLMQQRLMHAPIAEPAALHGVGPRVEEPGVGLIPLFAYFGPYEEMRLKKP
jgi:peptide/nickel transport system substrate-binding protein